MMKLDPKVKYASQCMYPSLPRQNAE